MTGSTYSKPFKTIPEQRDLLESRGMTVPDPAEAERWLGTVGYYRLSGYWYPYRAIHRLASGPPIVADDFSPGVSFEQVIGLYDFDRRLKLLVLDAVERVEIAMRMRIGHTLGLRGPFAHTDPSSLSAEFVKTRTPAVPPAHEDWLGSDHAKWLRNVAEQRKRSKEEFVKHYARTYGDPLPVWVVTEILDFGGLSRLYAGLMQKDRDTIAAGLNVIDSSGAGHGAALANWLKNITYIRNVCAHHSRLWNRNLDRQLSPKHLESVLELRHAASPVRTKRVYASLAVLAYLIEQVSPGATWATRVAQHVKEGLPALGRSADEMGFPPGWKNESLWSP